MKVKHTFYGETEAQADEAREAHLAACPYYTAAEDRGDTIEEVEENAEIPDWDELEAEDEDGEEEAEEEETEE